jgi:hypothetical protein
MKPTTARRGILLATAGVFLAPILAGASTIVIGSGPDISYFLLESPNLGQRHYEIYYTYNSSDPQDGAFLLQQIAASDSSVAIAIFGGSNIYVDSITFNGITEQGLQMPPFEPYWAHWVAGGQAGFPSAEPIANDVWSQGSGLSGPFRFIAPGSADALKFSDFTTPPTSSPIPEPSAVLLAGLGLITIVRRSR